MRFAREMLGGIAAVALVVAPLSSAQAGWHRHHGCWFVGCVVGAVVGTAAAVATAPIALAADAVAPRPYPPPGYYRPPPPGYYGPRGYYPPPPPGGYYGPRGAYGPPPPYPPQGYAPPQGYGPSPGY